VVSNTTSAATCNISRPLSILCDDKDGDRCATVQVGDAGGVPVCAARRRVVHAPAQVKFKCNPPLSHTGVTPQHNVRHVGLWHFNGAGCHHKSGSGANVARFDVYNGGLRAGSVACCVLVCCTCALCMNCADSALQSHPSHTL